MHVCDCMFVCLHVCMCACARVCVTCAHTVHVCTHTMHVCVHVCVCVDEFVYACVLRCDMFVYMNTYLQRVILQTSCI